MNYIDYEFVSEYCKKNWETECGNAIKISDDICNNTFLFNMPWDMERTDKPTHFDGEIDWNLKVNGDREYLFQMNRHRYFINLGQAYNLTKNKKYVECFIRLVKDWIEKNPCPFKSGDHPWRSLETGLRGEYWTKAMDLMKDSELISFEFVSLYKNCLKDHAEMLIACHTWHNKLSNWGVIQDHGLFAIGIELENQKYIDIALERLYAQANIQVMCDGFHWEASNLYHNEVLNCFLDVIIRADRAHISLNDSFVGNVKKMALVNVAVIKPNHKQPLFGDSDYTDLRDMLSQTALIFNSGEMKSLTYDKLDYESVWLFGKKGVNDYENITPVLPAFDSISLSDSANYIMRSGWENDADYLIFHNGYTGGGHAHEDKLSFDLSVGGKDVLTDCGRYTYKWTDERKYLKSYKAHNTLAVDGKHFIKSIGWGYKKLAPSVKQNMIVNNAFEFVSGTHLGYFKTYNPVVITRKILWIKPDIYIIIDELTARGRHKYNQYFNFSPEGTLKTGEDGCVFENHGIQTEFRFISDGLKLRPFDGLFSDHYNKIEKNSAIETEFKAYGNTNAITVIVGNREKYEKVEINTLPVILTENEKVLNNKSARGLKITLNQEEFTVSVVLGEKMRAVVCNEKYFAGEIAYYHNNDYNIVEW